MLELKKIKKEYSLNDFKQTALNGVSLKFRENEFVSILGPSGSGKTTMLNIIGGLDTYTSGDLIINGVSTKKYKDINWDTYRNHNVGFVFQSYNLISHQSILSNVELALTLSGVSKKERLDKAKEVLKKVGLEKHINKKPNQLSGGQMQRVAIARALINNPDILLADEPTGALDSETSTQIMELLKEIAKQKLVIMVTHNPELAQEYSTRIVKVLDGNILEDSNPFDGKDKTKEVETKGKKYMSFKTALNLSFNNLLTKKGRTLMTSFAGSIGIIGIATILSLSNGVQKYITRVEEDTLSSYPIQIMDQGMDTSSFISDMHDKKGQSSNKDENKVYSNDMMVDMLSLMTSKSTNNNLEEFKKFVDSSKELQEYLISVSYEYNLNLNLYKNVSDEVIKVNPSPFFGDDTGYTMFMMQSDVWAKIVDMDLTKTQYDLVAGTWSSGENEVLLALDENGELSDLTLYTLGIKDQSEIEEMINKIMKGETVNEPQTTSYTYDELLDLSFKAVLTSDYYKQSKNVWTNESENKEYMLEVLETALEVNVVGIIQPKTSSNMATMTTGGIYYNVELENYVIDETNNSAIVKEQLSNSEVNVLTGKEFDEGTDFDFSTLTKEEQAYLASLSPEEMQKVMEQYQVNAGITYDEVLETLGSFDLEKPSIINLYPKDFDSKKEVEAIIEEYNQTQKDNNLEENIITYTDYIGLMMSSVTVIIDMITYVLVAFVSISLVVSSIMIGIITYISVLERTKEIGILRAIGASKKDISRVFNAETFIIGLTSGMLGILITLLINVIANIVLYKIVQIDTLATLPITGAISLVIISVILTTLAGLIPSKMASKKNPVEALRTE